MGKLGFKIKKYALDLLLTISQHQLSLGVKLALESLKEFLFKLDLKPLVGA